MSTQSILRLSEFIRTHMESILQAWEKFARTIEPPALTMNTKDLRDHASHMLTAIANDLDRGQSLREEIAKSEGRANHGVDDTAAETHGVARLLSGYSIQQLASEYRALRSSVLRLWAAQTRQGLKTDPEDITRFNEAIDQSLAESIDSYSEALDQSRNLFLAILGHDLRNPLGTTINGAELLIRSENLETRYQNIALRIYNSGIRMSKLVDDLIDFTRTHLGANLPISPKPTNIAVIAQSAIDEIRTSHQKRDISLQVHGDTNGIWDEARIAQVISNLVGNAVQHGTSEDPIAVSITSNEDHLILSINNHGPCIPQDKLATIFEPLVRLAQEDDTQETNQTSLGLGLYIAREVVKAHGGSLNVTSDTTDGTTFTLRLPRVNNTDT